VKVALVQFKEAGKKYYFSYEGLTLEYNNETIVVKNTTLVDDITWLKRMLISAEIIDIK
jgi:hypothetical protein